MARTPEIKKATTRSSKVKPTRATTKGAPKVKARNTYEPDEPNEHSDNDNEQEDLTDSENNEPKSHTASRALAHKNTKRNATGTSTFKTKKDLLYASSRKSAQEISAVGLNHLEEARATVQEMRREDLSCSKIEEDFRQLFLATEAAVGSISECIGPITNEIAVKRKQEIDSGLQLVQSSAPGKRCSAHKKTIRNAMRRVEEIRKTEQDARDASTLIKHYKKLLYA